MASDLHTIAWERLTPPPRHVPRAVQARVRSAEIKNTLMLGNGFVGLFSLLVSVSLIVFGTVWFYVVDKDNYPTLGVFPAAAGISIWIGLAALMFVRGTRYIHLLRNGVAAQGTISKVPNQFNLIIATYDFPYWEGEAPAEPKTLQWLSRSFALPIRKNAKR